MSPHELKMAEGARVVCIRVRAGYTSEDPRVRQTLTLQADGTVVVDPPFDPKDDMREVPKVFPGGNRVYLTPEHGAEYMAAAAAYWGLFTGMAVEVDYMMPPKRET